MGKQMASMLLKGLWKLREKNIKALNYEHVAYICSNHILMFGTTPNNILKCSAAWNNMRNTNVHIK